MPTPSSHYWFPATSPSQRPAPWWYVGWVLYANRSTLLKAFFAFSSTSSMCFVAGWLLQLPLLQVIGLSLAGLGVILLLTSLVGLTLIYGPPARFYLRQLLQLGQVTQPRRVADLHIGTYRISYLLHDLLPNATVESIDIWDVTRFVTEPTLQMLRTLEVVPRDIPRLRYTQAYDQQLSLPDSSCDVVVLGLGFHEVPSGRPREQVLVEVKRILRPGGAVLLFEHTVDLQSLLIFGPDINHWASRSEWLNLLHTHFGPHVKHQRSPVAIDLFAAHRKE